MAVFLRQTSILFGDSRVGVNLPLRPNYNRLDGGQGRSAACGSVINSNVPLRGCGVGAIVILSPSSTQGKLREGSAIGSTADSSSPAAPQNENMKARLQPSA